MSILGVAACVGGAARAGTVNVANAGFESGNLSGWSIVASGGYASSGAGVINNSTNQSNAYPFFSNPLPGTASGTYFS